MENDIVNIIKKMTLDEKISLLSGRDFWRTKNIKRLNIPSITFSDGPHGIRKQKVFNDNLGLYGSKLATCYPSASALANSWNEDIIYKLGEYLGDECVSEGINILLGPGVNIKRTPLCGRNFEYFSEDPFLSSQMAVNYIKGVQSKEVGTSIKHFLANNQETKRMRIDAQIDERTLHEIYLASFEKAIKEGQPWTVMCSYNKVNGEYCSENNYLLKDILINKWGFEGFIVSDWGAVNSRIDGVKAGLHLEMPSSKNLNSMVLKKAVKKDELDEKYIDFAVERILKIVNKAVERQTQKNPYDKEKHHKFANDIATECMVLVKNEDNILPLSKESQIAVIGELAITPRFQGGGSSHINPTKLDKPLEEIEKIVLDKSKIRFSKGYSIKNEILNERLLKEALEIAAVCPLVILFIGLPEYYESEGYDRPDIKLPKNQLKLLHELYDVNSNIVVVLTSGAPVEMPWIDETKAVLLTYLSGQAMGSATAQILFGDKNPSGKLAETIPHKLSQTPAYLSFPGDGKHAIYSEGVFVGYRFYDAREIEPLFPFGYGLSYSEFEYSNLSIEKKPLNNEINIVVKLNIKNSGQVLGKEIVQLYVSSLKSTVKKPVKELKGFKKIELKPGDNKEVEFNLDKRAFSYYNTEIHDWYVESGDYAILIGKSSRQIVLASKINIISDIKILKEYDVYSTVEEILETDSGKEYFGKFIKILTTIDRFLNHSNSHFSLQNMFKRVQLKFITMVSNSIFNDKKIKNLLTKVNEETKVISKKKGK
ncbi:glycoside hydrolase family 3 C-terminal domain-containing protein [Clostridium sp. DL1XJH146]